MIKDRDGAQIQQVRKIKPTRRSVSGYYAFRGQGAVAFESTLERDFLVRAEFSRTVLDVVAQPVSVDFVGVNGQTYQYTPDYLMTFRLGNRGMAFFPKPLLIEVKPEAEWREHWRTWANKWKAAGRYAEAQGWSFRIHDESRIRDQMFQNVRMLDRFKRMRFPAEELAELLTRLDCADCLSVAALLPPGSAGRERAESTAQLWHLLAIRQVDCDMRYPLDESTELWTVNDD